jgi:hypothetical protein
MYLVTLRMDRVYDVHKDPYSPNIQRTLFSFDSNGKKYFALSVPGQPKFENGQTITAALDRKDDWHSLRGLIIHETGQLCASSRSFYVWAAAMAVFFAAFTYIELKFQRPDLIPFVLSAISILGVYFAYTAYSVSKVIRALRGAAS